jgi:hypothetical protein
MANSNGWGDGAANNAIGWGQGANNAIGWGDIHADSWAGLTDISGLPTTDPDAQAFITAAAITNPTQQAAINTLVVNLKGYSIWTKMKALYPFVGGTAAQHKWNLKNPLDTDAAFRILWSGGVTHSSNGVQFGGVNGYGNTKLIPSTNLTLNSNHISVYSRTNVAESKIDFGIQDDSVTGVDFRRFYLSTRNLSNNFVAAITCLDANRISSSNTDARGFYLGSRISNTSLKGYKNGTLQQTNTVSGGASQATDFTALGGLTYKNDVSTSVINYSSKQLAFASIGDGLTDTEAANFYTAVQNFNTALARQV